jgi:hypothetical protein
MSTCTELNISMFMSRGVYPSPGCLPCLLPLPVFCFLLLRMRAAFSLSRLVPFFLFSVIFLL